MAMSRPPKRTRRLRRTTPRWETGLAEDAGDVLLDGALGHSHLVRDGVVRATLRHELEHLTLARGQLLQRVVAAGAAHELGNDLGIERRAAVGHAPHRLDEAVHVGHAVLQQVADAARGLADQVEGVALLHVLGQHQHARVGELRPDLERGP
jgi:hypothetical protein